MSNRFRLKRPGTWMLASMWLVVGAASANALVITPVFDSSITTNPNAAAIETAFYNATYAYDYALPNPVTVRLLVSWGRVDGRGLSSATLGASLDPLYGNYSYAQVKSWLTHAATTSTDATTIGNLPANPASGNRYVLPAAEARAMGLLPKSSSSYDGYIGFGAGVSYDFTPSDGISAGSYDFTAVAAHEIAETLGRISGLVSSSPGYATIFDLFRCGSNGAPSFSYAAAAYFSLNGCRTALGTFNNSGSGDRGDWASAPAYVDAQDAYLYPGVTMGISVADLMALDALGWSSAWSYLDALGPSGLVFAGYAGDVPEPASVVLLATGLLASVVLRRRSRVLQLMTPPN